MQGVIPATLVATRIAFGRRFKFMHYLGAFVIVAGIAVSVISDRLERVDTVGNTVLWALLFFFFNIPAGSFCPVVGCVCVCVPVCVCVCCMWWFGGLLGMALKWC